MSRNLQVRGSNRLSSGAGYTVRRSLARVVERVRLGMFQSLASARRRATSVDTLEDRRLFDFTLGGAGQWTFLNSGTINQPAIVMFQSTGGTGAGQASFAVTNGGGNTALDTINFTNIDLGGGAGPFTVNLASSIGVGQVNFTNYTAGAQITLVLRLQNITDTDNNANSIAPSAAAITNGPGAFSLANNQYQSTNPDYSGPDNADAGNLLGATYSPAKLGSASVGNVNFTNALVGSVTVRNFGVTTNTGVAVNILNGGDLGATGLAITTEGGMNVSVGSASTTTISAAGGLSIAGVSGANSVAGPIGQVSVGNVLATGGAGGIALTGTTVAGVSIGNLTFTNASSGGVTIGGTDVTGISFGQITRGSPANTDASSSIVIQNAGTTGTISFSGIATTGQGALTIARNNQGTSVGAVNLGVVNFANSSGTPSSSIGFTNTGAIASVSATSYTVTGTASGNININNGGALTNGLTINGGLTYVTSGTAQLNVTSGGNVGTISLSGAIVIGGVGDQNFANAVNVQPTGAIGNITLGSISLLDSANTDRADFRFLAGGVNQNIGNLTVGAVTINTGGTTNITANSSGTGAVGNLQIGDISVNGASNSGGFDVLLGDGDATGSPTVTLGNLALDQFAFERVRVNAASIGTLTVGNTWSILNGSQATLGLTAHGTDASIATLGSNNWAVTVGDSAGLTYNLTATGTINAVTFNTIDLTYNNNNINSAGNLTFNATADSDQNSTGAFSGLTVRNAGTNTPTVNAGGGATILGPEQKTITTANIIAAQVGNIQIAGSVSNFNVTAQSGTVPNASTRAQATIGNVTFGQTVGGAGVPDSYNDTVVLSAEGGIGNITVAGDRSVLTNVNINANTDGDTQGSLGNITVTGQGGLTAATQNINGVGSNARIRGLSTTGGGGIRGASIGNIQVDNGDVVITNLITNTGGDQTARNTTNNAIGNITVGQGNLTVTTLTADDGVGNITVNSIDKTATAGTITITTLTTDNDAATGVANAASIGGGLGNVVANGNITITTLDTNTTDTTNVQAGNSVGTITSANGSVTISTVDVAGNLGQITASRGASIATANNAAQQRINGNLLGVILTNTNAAGGGNSITLGDNSHNTRIGGNLGVLQTTLGNTDNLTLRNVEVFGSASSLNAGEGRLVLNGLTIHQVTVPASGPTLKFTGGQANNAVVDAVDLLLDVRNATGLVLDTTVTIDTYVPAGNTLTINDITGTTAYNAAANTGTDLTLAARLANSADGTAKVYTNSLGIRDTNYFFSLGGIADSYTIGVAGSGRHSFRTIKVEGNLGGNIGFDSNRLDGTAATIAPSSPEPILGDIGSLIIQGEWSNSGSTIFVNSIKTFSFGTIQSPDNASPVGFKYETPNVGFDGTANAGGNINPNASLEVYTVLTTSPINNLQVPLDPTSNSNFVFVGPTGAFERVNIRNNSGSRFDTVELNATGGVFQNIYGFGEQLGFEYNAANPFTSAFTGATNFNYGTNSPGGLTATSVSSNGVNAFDYLDISSRIGNINVLDANTTDNIAPALGPVFVGYVVTLDNGSDLTGTANSFTSNYYRNTGDNSVTVSVKALRLVVGGTTPTIVRGDATNTTLGNINVQGPVGNILASGNVGSITTTDTTLANRISNTASGTASRFGTANLGGVIAAGTVGAIIVQGNVLTSLVAGNTTVTSITSLGADNALGGTTINADTLVYGTIIPVGSQGFTGDITVLGGNLGSTGNAGTVTVDTVTVPGSGIISSTSGNVVSAPYGIGVNITVRAINSQLSDADLIAAGLGGSNEQGRLRAAIVAGAHTLQGLTSVAPNTYTKLVPTVSEESDDLTGNVLAVDIAGDIVANDDISGSISAIGLKGLDGVSGDGVLVTAPSSFAAGAINSAGAITSTKIYATGGSPGDITGNILAAGTITGTLIQAGSGSGGSILANIIAGTDGIGALTNVTIQADDSIGGAGFTNIISAADTSVLTAVRVGVQTVASITPANAVDGGNLNSDISVGRLVGTLVPQQTGFAEAGIPLFSTNSAGGSSNLTITNVQVGQTTSSTNLNSNINAAIVAAQNVTITTLYVDGNVNGNNGVIGTHFIAGGLGYLSTSAVTVSGASGTTPAVLGNLGGTITAGTFADRSATTSPFNANDGTNTAAGIAPGTILTRGSVTANLIVGSWDYGNAIADATELSDYVGSPGVAPTTRLTVNNFIPNFSVGATDTVNLSILAQGLQFTSPQSAQGSTINFATGVVNGVTVAAFNGVANGATTYAGAGAVPAVSGIQANGSVDINFVLANIDALTAFQFLGVGNTSNPSSPTTNNGLNDGSSAANALNIRANGIGAAGVTLGDYLSGFDPFAYIAGGQTNFFNRFGLGTATGSLVSRDGNSANGYAAGTFNLGLLAAGNDVSASITTDGNLVNDADPFGVFSTAFGDAAVLAGLSAKAITDGLNPSNIATNFNGGNYSGNLSVGQSIGSATQRFNIGALAGTSTVTGALVGAATNGNISGNITSGTRDQFGPGSNVSTDIFALLVAANSVTGTIDAGDVFPANTPVSGLTGGSFVGGIIAGAGNDLNIDSGADNILAGNISGGQIRTASNLDVTGLGIRAENAIGSPIVVGYGANGGNLLGDINAETNISEIQVWGDVGTVANPSRIYTGGAIPIFFVGNSPFAGAATTTATKPRPTSLYVGGVGTLNAKVYQGGVGSTTTTQIFVGGSIGTASNLVLGAQDGLGGSGTSTSVSISQNANLQQLTSTAGGRVLVTLSGADIAAANAVNTAAAPAIGVIDVVLRTASATLTSNNTGTGPLGLRDLLAGDTLAGLTINDGSIRSINVDDDVDIQSILNGYLATLGTAPSTLVNVANSLPLVGAMAQAFNNDLSPIGISGGINVDYNIGVTSVGTNTAAGQLQSIGRGFNTSFTNWAIRTQGAIALGANNITSNLGSIGNILAGTSFSANSNVGIAAYGSIGSLYATTGGLSNFNLNALTGDIGVLSARDNITQLFIAAPAGSLGGLFSRNGSIGATSTNFGSPESTTRVTVHNNVGPIRSSTDIVNLSIIAETGDIGVDLDASDYYTGVTATVPSRTSSTTFGIYSEAGNISQVSFVAGRNIGGIYAPVGSIFGNATRLATSSTNLVPNYFQAGSSNDFTYQITGTGTRQAYISSVDTQLKAGGNVGSIVALQDITNLLVTAGGNVGNLISVAGRVGGAVRATSGGASSQSSITINEYGTNSFSSVPSVSSPQTVNLRPEQGVLYVVARGSIGDVDALLDVGTKTVSHQLVYGTFSISGGVTLTSNAQIEIDPVTLKLRVLPLSTTSSTGIGNVFSHTGDVNATLVTSGNIGYASTVGTNTVVGGVSAPLGQANVNIKAGGTIGGVYGGKGTTFTPDSSFASIGSAPTTPGTYNAQVSDGNPLVLSLSSGVTYVVNVTSSTGSVNYTVNDDDTVVFNTVQLTTTGANASVQVFTTTGDRGDVLNEISSNVLSGGTLATNATTGAVVLGSKSSVLTTVKSLISAGGLSNVRIEGDLTAATVNGNLSGGTVSVTGDLGDLNVTGNIGTTNTAGFTAGGLSLQVGSGKVGSVTAGGTNFGLKTVTLSNGQYLSWANTLTSGVASSFLNAYVRTGSAVLTINNGYLQSISLTSASTSGLLVFASGTTFDTATDAVPTNRGVNRDNDAVLASYAGFGSLPRNTTRPTFKGDNGSNVANVGTISTDIAGRSARVSNLVIEGSVGNLLLNKGQLVNQDPSTTAFTANLVNGSVYGGVANASVSGSVLNTAIRGNVAKLTASVAQNLAISGDATVVSASKVIDGLRVSGNAGTISSGGPINNIRVDGSAIKISARSANGVVVAGSVGVQVAGPTTSNSLGSVFSASTIAAALGLQANNLADGADAGPGGTKYLGGINISLTANRVSVGGLISDLVLGRVVNTIGQNLLGQTIDDGTVGVASNRFFTKIDGILQTSTPVALA